MKINLKTKIRTQEIDYAGMEGKEIETSVRKRETDKGSERERVREREREKR